MNSEDEELDPIPQNRKRRRTSMEEEEIEHLVFRNGESSLGKELNALRETGELCDIVIKIGDSRIRAHKVVLSAGSRVFKAMILGGFKESSQQEIELPSLIGSAVCRVVDYLYTGIFKIQKNTDLDMLKDIVQAADFLDLPELAKWILNDVVIQTKLAYSNMKKILEAFDTLDIEQKVEKEIRQELKANWEDFIEDYPEDLSFLLKICPDFDGHIEIRSYENLTAIVNALRDLNEDILTKFLKNASFSITADAKRICMERNPELYYIFEVKYKSKENLDWIAHVFYDLPEDIDQSVKFLESLLAFLQQQSEVLRAPFFRFKCEALYKFRTCGPIQSLARMILEIIGKNNKIILTMRLGEEDGNFIAFCNKFIIGCGSERMELDSLVIHANDDNLILDSFSKHLIGEMMAEVEHVELDGLILSIGILKSLLHCNERKALAGKAKLTSLCLHEDFRTYSDHYALFSEMGTFLKEIELTGWKTKNVIQFLNSFTGFKNVLQTLKLTEMIKEEMDDEIVPSLKYFLDSSIIEKVSFANSMLSRKSLDALVVAAQENLLPIDTLVLCQVEIVDEAMDSHYHLEQMAKLIGLIPLVTISGRYVTKSTLKMMRETIRRFDKDERSGRVKASILKGGIFLKDDAMAMDELYLWQYHASRVCQVDEGDSNFLELGEYNELPPDLAD